MVEESFEETSRLLRTAASGDGSALGLLFERCRAPLLKHIRSGLDAQLRDFLESGDVMHETFLDIVRAFERTEIRDEDSFLRWAARIATNHLRDQLRRRRVRSMERLTSTLCESAARSDESPAQNALSYDRVRQLQDSLAALPEEYRRSIELRDLAQRSYEQIAELMGLPTAAAAQRMRSRAMTRLTKLVREGSGRADHSSS